MTRLEAFQALAKQWQELHPEVEISHKNEKNIPEAVLNARLAYINDGLRELGFIK